MTAIPFGMFRPGSGGGLDPYAVSYGSSNFHNRGVSASPFSIASLTIGTAPTGANVRTVVAAIAVVCATGTATTVTGVTIGGVSATSLFNIASTHHVHCYFAASVPTGTTATVVVTCSDSDGLTCGVSTYIVTNITSTSADDTENGTAQNQTLNLTITGGGHAMGVSSSLDATSGTSTWSGMTENYDADIRSNEYFSTALGQNGSCSRNIAAVGLGAFASSCSIH